MTSSRHQADNGSRHFTRVQHLADPETMHRGSGFLRNLPNSDLRRIAPHLSLRDFVQRVHPLRR